MYPFGEPGNFDRRHEIRRVGGSDPGSLRRKTTVARLDGNRDIDAGPTVRPPDVRVLGRFRAGRVMIVPVGTILAVAVPHKLDRHVPIVANA